MTELRIDVLLGVFVAVLAGLWIASPRTRKLAVFAVIVVVAGPALFALATLIRVLWFPFPPM